MRGPAPPNRNAPTWIIPLKICIPSEGFFWRMQRATLLRLLREHPDASEEEIAMLAAQEVAQQPDPHLLARMTQLSSVCCEK